MTNPAVQEMKRILQYKYIKPIDATPLRLKRIWLHFLTIGPRVDYKAEWTKNLTYITHQISGFPPDADLQLPNKYASIDEVWDAVGTIAHWIARNAKQVHTINLLMETNEIKPCPNGDAPDCNLCAGKGVAQLSGGLTLNPDVFL